MKVVGSSKCEVGSVFNGCDLEFQAKNFIRFETYTKVKYTWYPNSVESH